VPFDFAQRRLYDTRVYLSLFPALRRWAIAVAHLLLPAAYAAGSILAPLRDWRALRPVTSQQTVGVLSVLCDLGGEMSCLWSIARKRGLNPR
jgi:hypothetical protein